MTDLDVLRQEENLRMAGYIKAFREVMDAKCSRCNYAYGCLGCVFSDGEMRMHMEDVLALMDKHDHDACMRFFDENDLAEAVKRHRDRERAMNGCARRAAGDVRRISGMDNDRNQRRQRNIEIFLDTKRKCNEIAYLAGSIDKTIRDSRLILEHDTLPEFPASVNAKPAEVIVSGRRSFEAARRYADKKVCVLNFASATGPGGGVCRGSSAQEESLCRCSTLYPALDQEDLRKGFYVPHREARSRFYNDDIIYCPGIVVFKSDDDFPEMMSREEWYTVDVLTCAAPNLRHFEEYEPNRARGFMSGGELEKLLEKRIRRIFEVAVRERAEVLILGAFGCGAFRNPPDLVASAFLKAVCEYGSYFETIEFAVFHMDFESENYRAFCRVFSDRAKVTA